MEKRYQVFVSSTYEDLIEERNEVIQALLELDCIPTGMEYFPAADETQWDFIKKLIEESDYYIVLIAGKYGSVDERGISYTQKEYEYALKCGIPTIAFIHFDTESLISSKTEKDADKIKKLEDFKSLVKKKLCKFWKTTQELGAVVSRSISQAKKNYPRTGWVRADSISESSEKEIAHLYRQIALLERKLEESNKFIESTKQNFEDLAEGEDKLQINVDVKTGQWGKEKTKREKIETTWNEINYQLLPKLIDSIRLSVFKLTLNYVATQMFLNRKIGEQFERDVKVIVTKEFMETVRIQLTLLEIIRIYDEEIIEDEETKFIKKIGLTSKGKEALLALRAVKK